MGIKNRKKLLTLFFTCLFTIVLNVGTALATKLEVSFLYDGVVVTDLEMGIATHTAFDNPAMSDLLVAKIEGLSPETIADIDALSSSNNEVVSVLAYDVNDPEEQVSAINVDDEGIGLVALRAEGNSLGEAEISLKVKDSSTGEFVVGDMKLAVLKPELSIQVKDKLYVAGDVLEIAPSVDIDTIEFKAKYVQPGKTEPAFFSCTSCSSAIEYSHTSPEPASVNGEASFEMNIREGGIPAIYSPVFVSYGQPSAVSSNFGIAYEVPAPKFLMRDAETGEPVSKLNMGTNQEYSLLISGYDLPVKNVDIELETFLANIEGGSVSPSNHVAHVNGSGEMESVIATVATGSLESEGYFVVIASDDQQIVHSASIELKVADTVEEPTLGLYDELGEEITGLELLGSGDENITIRAESLPKFSEITYSWLVGDDIEIEPATIVLNSGENGSAEFTTSLKASQSGEPGSYELELGAYHEGVKIVKRELNVIIKDSEPRTYFADLSGEVISDVNLKTSSSENLVLRGEEFPEGLYKINFVADQPEIIVIEPEVVELEIDGDLNQPFVISSLDKPGNASMEMLVRDSKGNIIVSKDLPVDVAGPTFSVEIRESGGNELPTPIKINEANNPLGLTFRVESAPGDEFELDVESSKLKVVPEEMEFFIDDDGKYEDFITVLAEEIGEDSLSFHFKNKNTGVVVVKDFNVLVESTLRHRVLNNDGVEVESLAVEPRASIYSLALEGALVEAEKDIYVEIACDANSGIDNVTTSPKIIKVDKGGSSEPMNAYFIVDSTMEPGSSTSGACSFSYYRLDDGEEILGKSLSITTKMPNIEPSDVALVYGVARPNPINKKQTKSLLVENKVVVNGDNKAVVINDLNKQLLSLLSSELMNEVNSLGFVVRRASVQIKQLNDNLELSGKLIPSEFKLIEENLSTMDTKEVILLNNQLATPAAKFDKTNVQLMSLKYRAPLVDRIENYLNNIEAVMLKPIKRKLKKYPSGRIVNRDIKTIRQYLENIDFIISRIQEQR